MKVLSGLVLISFLIVLAGCVPSLNPLYTDRDVIFDPALLGVVLVQFRDPGTGVEKASHDYPPLMQQVVALE